MNTIIKQISLLYDQELYSNIISLAELAATVCEEKPDFCTPFEKFQFHVYYAEALFNSEEYGIAEKNYTQALQTRKHMTKIKNSSNKQLKETELMNDSEIKFKICRCFMKLKQNRKAIEILESIPVRNRTPKINMTLGNLYKEIGNDRPAITCFKETLKECPSALKTAENLLNLDIKSIELATLMCDVTSEINWINVWLKAKSQMHAGDFSSAILLFKSLDNTGILRDNVRLLVNMGYCFHYLCNESAAISTLQRALKLDPLLKSGRDLLASLLATSNNKELHNELEKIIPIETDTSLWPSEYWTVMGYFMLTQKKYERALFLSQQACKLERNIDALLLKARVYVQLNKLYDASPDVREALLICPYRFDLHKELIQIYLATNRVRDAINIANNACKRLNNNPPSLTLYASVLIKDAMNASKAKGILEKAIGSDPPYLPAIFLLVELFKRDQAYENAVKLMKKYTEVTNSSKLHQLLAECYVKLQKDEEAFDHFNIALRIDASNQRALEGMDNIGRTATSSKLESTCYITARGDSSQTGTTPDPEVDPDSDTDNWPNSGNHVISFSV